MIQFSVRGKPVPQPRPRATAIGGHARVYTPANSPIARWRSDIREAAVVAMEGLEPLIGRVQIRLTVMIPRPQSHLDIRGDLKKGSPKDPIGRRSGDVDNYAKGVLDAMNGVVYEDDSQVDALVITKLYEEDEDRGVRIKVEQFG